MANKYRNQRTSGYSSKKEANRAAELWILFRAGLITDFHEQFRFILLPKLMPDYPRPLVYVCDFYYLDDKGVRHVEDTKGYRTREYRIKKRLMRQLLHIDIEEI